MPPRLSEKRACKIREENTKSLKKALKKEQGVQVTHNYYIKVLMEEAHHKCHLTKGTRSKNFLRKTKRINGWPVILHPSKK